MKTKRFIVTAALLVAVGVTTAMAAGTTVPAIRRRRLSYRRVESRRHGLDVGRE